MRWSIASRSILANTALDCGLSRSRMWRPSSGSPDWQSHDSAHISRHVWKSAGVWLSSIGDAVMQRRRPDWRLATDLGLSRSQKSYLSHLRRTTAREQSWNGLACAAILMRISTILRYRKVIHSEGMYFTGSVRVRICADFRFWHIPDLPQGVIDIRTLAKTGQIRPQ